MLLFEGEINAGQKKREEKNGNIFTAGNERLSDFNGQGSHRGIAQTDARFR